MINRNESTPLHQQVSSWIRDRIYGKEWDKDEKIPSEYELMERLEVSRGTVKKAIKNLIDEGLLISVQGKGTYVSSNVIDPPISGGLLSIAESLTKQNVDFKTTVVKKEIIEANHDVAEMLNITEGSPILYMKRLRYVGDEVIMVIENRINIALVYGLENSDFESKSLFNEIERITGNKIQYSHTRYAARHLGSENAKYLGSPIDAPILHMEQTVFLDNDSIIEWGNVWLKANRYIAGTVLQRP